jgi:hypothetical protein
MNSFPSEQDKKRLAGLVAYPYRLIVLFVAVGEVIFVTSHIFECQDRGTLLPFVAPSNRYISLSGIPYVSLSLGKASNHIPSA